MQEKCGFTGIASGMYKGEAQFGNLVFDTSCRVVVVSWFHPAHPGECFDNTYV
jgi:hypothetical protein